MTFVPTPEPGEQPLQLDTALQLLRQSGHALPAGDPGSAQWLQELVDALVELSSRDALTGLANRRSFDLALGREVDRVARSGEPALLLSLDIDHFKRVNDTWGHAAGDEVLKTVARVLQETVRPMDLVARVGGEEFAIILPEVGAPGAAQMADKLRRSIEETSFRFEGTVVPVTVSLGVAEWDPSIQDPDELVKRADAKLYEAKRGGRNQVRL